MTYESHPRPRADRAPHGAPPVESGPLGPPPLPLDHDPGALTLDELADRLSSEDRYFQERIRNLEGALKESSQNVVAFEERHTRAASRLRELRATINLHGRQAIFEAGEEARQAEVKYEGLRELCEYLQTQLQAAQRAHEAVQLARQAVARAEPANDPGLERSEHTYDPGLERPGHTYDPGLERPGHTYDPGLERPGHTYDPGLERPGHTYDPGLERPGHGRGDSGGVTPGLPPAPSVALVSRNDVLAARERERHALARRLQEQLSHPLADALLNVDLCAGALHSDPVRAGEAITGLRYALNTTLRDTRMLIFELEPLTLADLGLAATLEHYVQALMVRGGPTALSFAARRPELRFATEIECAFFRVAREAVANALRHARARVVRVTLHQRPDLLALCVEDDGVGFAVDDVLEPARHRYHTGLGQLRLEARMIGADLVIESGPGAGTLVACVLDVAPEDEP